MSTDPNEYQFYFQNIYSGNVFKRVIYTAPVKLMNLSDNCFVAVVPMLDKIEIWKQKELPINPDLEKTYECQNTKSNSHNQAELSNSYMIHDRLLRLDSATFASVPGIGNIKIYRLDALDKPLKIMTLERITDIENLAKAPNGNLFVLSHFAGLILFDVQSVKPTRKNILYPRSKGFHDENFNSNCFLILNNDQSTVMSDDDIKQARENGICVVPNAFPLKNQQQVVSFVAKTGNLHFWQKNNKYLPKNDCNKIQSQYQGYPK